MCHSLFFPRLEIRCVNFLWLGCAERGKYHLVNWERLSEIKCLGGWDIKNIQWFNTALSMQSMWRGLFGKGLWSEVLRGKYIKRSTLGWIRNLIKNTRNVSNLWRGFTKVLGLIEG